MTRFTCEICGKETCGYPFQVRRISQAPKDIAEFLEFAKTFTHDKWVCFVSIACDSERCRHIARHGGIPGRIYREFGDDGLTRE